MTVSKRLRFEILRRDNHACRYCGRSAPDVELTVDHVTPVALGGSDEPPNLVTACRDCNGGKSSVPADAATVADVAQDAVRWSAAMSHAADEMTARSEDRADIYVAIDAVWYQGKRPDDWTDTIDRFLDAGLPVDVILKMVRVAQNKRGGMGYRWSYFCGCCWKRIRQLQDRAVEILTDEAKAAFNG